MKFRTALAALAILTGCALHSAQAADTWIKAESEHFVVYSNLDTKTASAYLLKLEQFRYVLASLFGVEQDKETKFPRLPVYFVKSVADLQQTFPNFPYPVSGYFKNCVQGEYAVAAHEDGGWFVDEGEDDSQEILFHEYSHNFMRQVSDLVYPMWYVEGFAEFYSTVRIDGDSALVGMAKMGRVRILNEADHSISYDKLLRGDMGSSVPAFYAQSWLLTAYIFGDPKRHKLLAPYVDAYRRGEDPVAAFEKIFGVKVEDLYDVLSAYMSKAKAYEYRFDGMPAPGIAIGTLPTSANKLLLLNAGAQCSDGNARPKILSMIRTEAAKYPADDYAKSTLARAEIILGDEWKALDYLKARTAASPNDADAQFMLGEALLLSTLHKHIQPGESDVSQMDAARKALGLGYKLDPLNAADLYFYSRALDVPGQISSEIRLNAAVQAHILAPSVPDYSIEAAYLLAERGRMEEAKTVLEPLAGNPHASARALDAIKNIVATIDRHASTEEVLAAFNGPKH